MRRSPDDARRQPAHKSRGSIHPANVVDAQPEEQMPGPSDGRIKHLSGDRPTSIDGGDANMRPKRRPWWAQGFLPIVVLVVLSAGAFWLWRLQVGNDLREGT